MLLVVLVTVVLGLMFGVAVLLLMIILVVVVEIVILLVPSSVQADSFVRNGRRGRPATGGWRKRETTSWVTPALICTQLLFMAKGGERV